MLQTTRRAMLAVAWVAFIVSLFVRYTPGYFGDHTLFLVLGSFASLQVGERHDVTLALLAIAVSLFLVTPILIGTKRGRLTASVQRLTSVGLLGVWAVSFPWGQSSAPSKDNWLLGYYLLAVAHTLAFFACMLPSHVSPHRRAGPKAGFEVLPPSNAGEQT